MIFDQFWCKFQTLNHHNFTNSAPFGTFYGANNSVLSWLKRLNKVSELNFRIWWSFFDKIGVFWWISWNFRHKSIITPPIQLRFERLMARIVATWAYRKICEHLMSWNDEFDNVSCVKLMIFSSILLLSSNFESL